MKRLVLAIVGVVSLLGITAAAALADWPTTCVELNDLIEAGRGNHHNVGIYQRVHGDQAEAVCRSEHADSAFRFGARPYQLPARSDPAAYTQAFVERAINRYNTQGLQATLDYYNSPQSVDGPWYVFIFDENDVIVAHAPRPAFVGLHAREGFPTALQVVAAARPEGAWTSYTWVNTETGRTQSKHSWVVRHDGLVFGSGWYEPDPSRDDPTAYTKAFVNRGISVYNYFGIDAVLNYYNSPRSVDGPWYVFIFDENDVLVAHAPTPAIVGLHARDVVGPDSYPTGLQVVADATPEGAWSSYSWINPETGETESKHSWVVRHDGLVFGSGWYEPGPSKADLPGYTQALVQRAVNLHDSIGRDETLAYYNTPESADGPWYVFVIEDRDGVLYSVANANRPDIVGKTRERIDANGFNYGEAMAAVTEDSGGAWVSYLFTHPQTREDAPKHSWVVRVGNLIFGVGWYEGIE
jgi:cytochrome c